MAFFFCLFQTIFIPLNCYQISNQLIHHKDLKETPLPEMQLTPLENLILKAKTFEMAAPHELLGLAMDPPHMENVANTVLTLKEMGALQLTLGDQGYSPIDGDMTFLGVLMSSLPLDVRETRLIALGSCYGVLDECIIMGKQHKEQHIKIVFA